VYADEVVLRRGDIFTRESLGIVFFTGPDGNCTATLGMAYIGRNRDYSGTVLCRGEWGGGDKWMGV
jgi:hypothetical protein